MSHTTAHNDQSLAAMKLRIAALWMIAITCIVSVYAVSVLDDSRQCRPHPAPECASSGWAPLPGCGR